jgi:hypothetical protein
VSAQLALDLEPRLRLSKPQQLALQALAGLTSRDPWYVPAPRERASFFALSRKGLADRAFRARTTLVTYAITEAGRQWLAKSCAAFP